MTRTFPQLNARLLAAAVLSLAAACNVSASGQIPCVEDSSCPASYPVCKAGFCVEGTSSASVIIVGVQGKAPVAQVNGTVVVTVTARAASGLKTVSLDGGGKSFTSDATSANGFYTFTVDTTKLPDGDVALTAKATLGDATAAAKISDPFTLHVDNTPPSITAPSGAGAPSLSQTSASPGVVLTIDFRINEPAAVVATATDGTHTFPMSEVDSGTAGVRRVAFNTGANTPPGIYKVTLTATDDAGNSSSVTDSTSMPLKFTVVPPPLVKSFSGPVNVGSGKSMLLNYDLSGGIGVIAGSAGSGIPVNNLTAAGSSTVVAPTVTSSATVTYTLTVTNAAAVTSVASISVLVAPAPTATLVFTNAAGTANLGAAAIANPHDTVYLLPTFGGGSALLNGAAVASGTVLTISNLSQTTSFTILVTSPAGTMNTAIATATVNAVVRSFSVSPVFATTGLSTPFTFTSSHEGGGLSGSAGGTITGNGITTNLPIASGVGAQATLTTSLSGNATYTLTVNNSAGTPENPLATAIVTAVAPPVGTSLVTGNATNAITITNGTSTSLTPAFTNDSGGTAVIQDPTGTTVASGLVSGTPIQIGPTATTTYTLVITNRAGLVDNFRTATITVAPPPTQPAITTAATVTTLTSNTATVTAHNGFAYLWTISTGAFGIGGSSGVTVGSTNTMTYTAGPAGNAVITCQEVDAANTKSGKAIASVAVVAAVATPTVTAAGNVTASSTGNVASVVANSGMTYCWTITGATITAGGSAGGGGASCANGPGVTLNGLNSISYTAGLSGSVSLAVTENNAAGATSTPGAASQSIVAAASVETITAGSSGDITAAAGQTASVPTVSGMTHNWTINGGTITTLTIGDSITFTPSGGVGGSVTLSCTESNGANSVVNCTPKTLTIVGTPAQPTVTAASSVTVGSTGNVASVVAHPGMTYCWTVTRATITSGGSLGGGGANCVNGPGTASGGVNSISYTITGTPSQTVSLSVTESNPTGTSSPGTASQTIVATPAITATPSAIGSRESRTASVTSPVGGFTYNWSVTGADITSGQGTSTVTYIVTAQPGGIVNAVATATSGGGTSANSNTTIQTVAAGSYSTATNLATPRVGATVTLLNDGRILIAGGAPTASGIPTNTAVICNSLGEGCVATGNMNSPRMNHTATLLASGKVLVAGGYTVGGPGSPIDTADIFDPAAKTFTAVSGGGIMTAKRAGHVAVLLNDGLVLVAGGTTNGSAALSSAEIYDPANGTFGTFLGFTNSQMLLEPRMNFAAVKIAPTRILLIGSGTDGKGEVFDEVNITSTANVLLNATFTATSGALNGVTTNLTATLLNSTTVLIVGGHSGSAPTSTSYLYTIGTGGITATSMSLTTARELHTATQLIDGSVLIAGGTANGGASTATAEIFNAAGTTVSATGSMSNARSQHAATILVGGQVLMVGGLSSGNAGSVEVYQP